MMITLPFSAEVSSRLRWIVLGLIANGTGRLWAVHVVLAKGLKPVIEVVEIRHNE